VTKQCNTHIHQLVFNSIKLDYFKLMKHQSKRNTHSLRLQYWIQLEQQHTQTQAFVHTKTHTQGYFMCKAIQDIMREDV